MANLAASAVTINSSWTEGSVTGKRRSCRKVTLVLSGQGGTTNLITATVLGFNVLEESTLATKSDDTKVYPTCPNYAGSALLLTDPTQATDANRALPADITATVRLTVKGY